MAKTSATRRSKRQSKVVTSEVVEEEDKTGESKQKAETEKDDPSDSTGMKQEEDAPKENQDDRQDQDSQMDTVIEVKGSTTTVTVSWDKKNEEVDDLDNRTNATDQMMDTEEHISSSVDAVSSTEDPMSERAETEMEQEIQESGDSQNDVAAEDEATVTVTCDKKNKKGKSDHVQKETKKVKGKRKACSAAETSPVKKAKLINDGFCLFVGNLNDSKTFDEVKDSLANYLMKQSLLFQEIRLDRSRKHAFVDLASEMDLTKGLTLNGEVIHDKPMRIAKAKVKSEKDTVKVKASAEEKKAAKDERCLFLKNVPYNATKNDILEIFSEAIDVRFPGVAEGPDKGIAFVEYKTKTIAEKELQQKQGVKIQDRLLIVDHVGQKHVPKVTKTKNGKDKKKAAVSPSNTLFVSKLALSVKESDIKKVFQKAVSITVPQTHGKSRGYAFVEFATVAEAEKALQTTKNLTICRKPVGVHFSEMREKLEPAKFLTNRLFVMGLAEKTTAETLQSAFEGASSARVVMDKKTGVSKRFGFLDFESEEDCKAAKEAMEDSEIDGSQVTVAFAKAKTEKSPGSLAKPPPADGAQPAGPEAGGRKRKGRRGKGGRKGKGSGAETPQDAVKEVENKD